jgi:hypothetical protein
VAGTRLPAGSQRAGRAHLGGFLRLLLQQIDVEQQKAHAEHEELVHGLDVAEHLLQDGAATRILLELVEQHGRVVSCERRVHISHVGNAALASVRLRVVGPLLQVLKHRKQLPRIPRAAQHIL